MFLTTTSSILGTTLLYYMYTVKFEVLTVGGTFFVSLLDEQLVNVFSLRDFHYHNLLQKIPTIQWCIYSALHIETGTCLF